MKSKYSLGVLLAAVVLGTVALADRPSSHDLVVHEWGTFTSLQGGNGVLKNWKPLTASALPNFVYDWMAHPDLSNRMSLTLLVNKGAMRAQQRMETPVVYFYSDNEQTVDLSVKFPSGFITEWYPRASQMGPSVMDSNRLTDSNAISPVTQESLIRWSNLRVLPAAQHKELSKLLPDDHSGSHYFPARETDSAYVRLDADSSGGLRSELEKFLFYRGIGNFGTPLLVTMKSDDAVILKNTGREPVAHLFVLSVDGQAGGFTYVPQLLPGEEKVVTRVSPGDYLPPAALTGKLSKQMSRALVKEGLYPREATAMVHAWQSSWFAEQGTRVLYVLPRAWTDRILPMTLNPAPKQLARVMVGRAEIITPGLEQRLITQLNKARRDDPVAISELHQTMKSLGRFAEPVLTSALAKTGAPWNEQARLITLFDDRRAPL